MERVFSEKDVTRTKELRSRILSYDPDRYIQILWDRKGKQQYTTSVLKIADLVPANDGKAIVCLVQQGDNGKVHTAYDVLTISPERITLNGTHPLVAARNADCGTTLYKVIVEFEIRPGHPTRVNEYRRGKKTEDTGYLHPDIFATSAARK